MENSGGLVENSARDSGELMENSGTRTTHFGELRGELIRWHLSSESDVGACTLPEQKRYRSHDMLVHLRKQVGNSYPSVKEVTILSLVKPLVDATGFQAVWSDSQSQLKEIEDLIKSRWWSG